MSSVRGPGGGYSLGRDVHEIFIGEVINAVDEKVDTTLCRGETNCQDNSRCLTHDLWQDLSARIQDYLNGISLHELMNSRGVLEVARRQEGCQVSTRDGALPRSQTAGL